ncbi:hypothetical protein HDV00_007402 [Rhizophlyctis rosea]|nr:hypothetical protein HDV00_007402 [Rhizophlyctis rosea]
MSLSSPVNPFLIDTALRPGGTWVQNPWGPPQVDVQSSNGPMPRPNWGDDVGEKVIELVTTQPESGAQGDIFTNGQTAKGGGVTEYVAGGVVEFWTAVRMRGERGDYGFAIYLIDDAYFDYANPIASTLPKYQQPNWECRANFSQICKPYAPPLYTTPLPDGALLSNDTWSYCRWDTDQPSPLSGVPCPYEKGRRYNRVQFNQIGWPGDWRGNRTQRMWMAGVRIQRWVGTPVILEKLHLVVTCISLVLSSLATLISLIYILILHTRALKLSSLGDRMTALSLFGKRNMMFHFVIAMFCLLISDILSVWCNVLSNGVSAGDFANRLGQGAMFAQLVALSCHLVNRIFMYRAFQPITWYPKYLQYVLVFISSALPLGVGVYIMYFVMKSPPEWREPERFYVLLSAYVWFFALDNALTIASIVLLFRIRSRLARTQSPSASESNNAPTSTTHLAQKTAHRRARTVTFSLFVTLAIALFICGYCIYSWKKYPYIGQLAIRIYFVGYVHYLVSLRSVVRVWREGERSARSGTQSQGTLGRKSGDVRSYQVSSGVGKEGTNGGKGYTLSTTDMYKGLSAGHSTAGRSGSTLPPYDYERGVERDVTGFADRYGGGDGGYGEELQMGPVSRSDPGNPHSYNTYEDGLAQRSASTYSQRGRSQSQGQSQQQRSYGVTRTPSQHDRSRSRDNNHTRSPSHHRSPSQSRRDYTTDYSDYPAPPTPYSPTHQTTAFSYVSPAYSTVSSYVPPPTPTMQPGWSTPPVEYEVMQGRGGGGGHGRGRSRDARSDVGGTVNGREWGAGQQGGGGGGGGWHRVV